MTDRTDGAHDPDDLEPLTPEQEAEISALLAGLPDPAMPDDVVRRIDQALAGAGDGGATVTTLPAAEPARGRTPRGTRLLQAAAVVVLLVLGAGVTYGLVSGDDEQGAGVVAQESAAVAAEVPVSESGLDHDASNLAGHVRGLVSGSDQARLQSYDSSPAPSAAEGGVAAAAAAPDGEDDARSGKKEQDGSTAQTVLPPGQTEQAVRALMTDPEQRAACVARLAERPDDVPLAVDVARYAGRPAAVIVLPVVDDTSRVEVWVVGATCTDADQPFPLHFAVVTLT